MAIFKETVFWIFCALITYSIGMLIFGTSKLLLNDNADMISACASILGAVGSFFAIFVAIYLFHGWKIQKKYDLTKEISLSFLNTVLNLNSAFENMVATITEFGKITNDDELNYFGAHVDEYSKLYLDCLIDLKSKNNLHRGLVRDIEKDPPLFSLEELEIIVNCFKQFANTVENIYKDYDGTKVIDFFAEEKAISLEMNKYSAMIKMKIVTLNKECKPS